MPRTEKKFGYVSQPETQEFKQIVPSVASATTLNVLINIAARSAAEITASVFTAAPPSNLTVVSENSSASIALTSVSSTTSVANLGATLNGITFNRTSTGSPSLAVVWNSGAASPYNPCVASVSNNILTPISTSVSGFTANIGRGPMDPDFVNGRGDFSVHPSAYGSVFLNEDLGIFTRRGTVTGQIATVSSTPSISVVQSLLTTGSNFQRGTYCLEQGTTTTHGYGYSLFANSLTDGSNATTWGLDVVSEDAGTVTTGRITFTANTSGTDLATRRAVRGLSFFSASDFNPVYSEYAFSHPTATTSDNTYYGMVSTSASTTIGSVTLPPVESTAGIRIVSSTSTDRIRRMFDGSISYPPAPTGVTVPTDHTKNQVVSVKFSPNGNYLAIAYYRATDATSTATSVVVVYERDVLGNYSHIDSSGTVFPVPPVNNDCMQWSSDGGSVIVMSHITTASTNGFDIRVWAPDGITALKNIPTSNVVSWTNSWTKAPPAKHAISPSIGSTSIGESSGTITQNLGTVGNTPHCLYSFRSSSGAPLIVVSGGRSGGNASGITKQDINYTLTGIISGGQHSGYSQTVVGAYSLQAGSIAQISNIILSPGESLHIESSTDDSVDISAYGVEIT